MPLAIAAYVLAGAACIACFRYRHRAIGLRKKLLASTIRNEERAAQDHMELQLAEEFDRALAKVSSESHRALHDAVLTLQARHNEAQRWTEALPDAIVVHRGGVIEFINHPGEVLFATVSHEVLGTHIDTWLEGSISEREDESGEHDERHVQRPMAPPVVVSVSEVSVEFEGSPATLILLRDLTAQRRVEKRLRLADRMTSLGSLVAGIAHELNNPMSYVLANLEMLGDELRALELEPSQATELFEMLAESREGCMRISSTVGELQRFSRPPPTGNGGSLSQIVGSACAIAGSTIQSHAELNISIDDDTVLSEGADQLTHVLVNLLLNATESIVSLPPNDEQATVALRAFRQGDGDGTLIIEVSDTGPGIPEQLQERIFDPFYTTRLSGKATGLGLPICYSMVAAMGGNLEVESHEGAGAIMRVRLPSDLGVLSDPS
ncbi:MAG: hypothetical protein GY811_24255 [Myxococcales bacterium]|nr:hypothetical protein [Myxococcales bacterium]